MILGVLLFSYPNHICKSLRLIENEKQRIEDNENNHSVKMAEIIKRQNKVKTLIVDELKLLLGCDDLESAEIYYDYVNDLKQLDVAKANIEYLLSTCHTSRRAIKDNGFLLSMPIGRSNFKHISPSVVN